jgi:effector-binding domain-containing protein
VTTSFTVEMLDEQPAAVVRGTVPTDELPALFDRAFPEVVRVVEAQGLSLAGPPFGYYPRMPGATVDVAAGFPVSAPVRAEGEVSPLTLPGGRAITGVHVGSYESMEATYRELTEWAAAEHLQLAEHMWESYLTDPSAEPDPASWRTLITWPIT